MDKLQCHIHYRSCHKTDHEMNLKSHQFQCPTTRRRESDCWHQFRWFRPLLFEIMEHYNEECKGRSLLNHPGNWLNFVIWRCPEFQPFVVATCRGPARRQPIGRTERRDQKAHRIPKGRLSIPIIAFYSILLTSCAKSWWYLSEIFFWICASFSSSHQSSIAFCIESLTLWIRELHHTINAEDLSSVNRGQICKQSILSRWLINSKCWSGFANRAEVVVVCG